MAKKAKKTFRITGRVIDRKTRRGISGLRVEGWDKDLILNDLVGSAVTDEQGAFSIGFTASSLKELFLNRQPDLFFKVFRDDALLTSTEDSVSWNVGAAETEVVIEVDLVKEDAVLENEFSVSGDVRRTDGRPLPAPVLVRAYDQGLRHRALLGEGSTASDGRYIIRYPSARLLDPKRGSANLMVEVIGGNGEVLATSDVRFNAGRQEAIRLQVDAEPGLSEWERVNAQLSPALMGMPLAQVTDDDLHFLGKTTRLIPDQLKRRVQAAQAAGQSELPEWFHYALLRQGLPRETEALINMPLSRVREAVSTAQKHAVVPTPAEEEAESLWRRFEALQTKYALDKRLPGRQLTFGQVLGAAGLDDNTRGVLARALMNKDLRAPATWSSNLSEMGLEAAVIARSEFALQTAEVTNDHVGVLTALLQDARVSSLRDVAKHYDQEAWQALVEANPAQDGSDLPPEIDGDTPDERRRRFAERLFDRVAEAHPDVAVIYGLTRQSTLSERPAARLLPQILEADAGFDLARAPLDAYVREHRERLGIPKGDDAEETKVRDDLKRVQRVYRLRAEPRAVARLLEDGLDSSSAILSKGREQFLAEYGAEFGNDTAKAIYSRAETNAARALAVYARFSPTITARPLPAAIGDCPAALKGVPNYTTLFGSLDGCECEVCESVYSPAAYLTDLLAFLQSEVKGKAGSFAPNNGLDAIKTRSFCDRNGQFVSRWPRRPDILDVKLSCRNAETLIPYVDLVLEILEGAVAPRNEGTPQTTLTAEDLAAQPEHVIPEAYDKLAQAVFPFRLPLDLWHEEAALYLDKLGTSRAELLETLFPFAFVEGDTHHDLTEIRRWEDSTIAAARLGLTSTEWKLIAGQLLTPVRLAMQMWGYPVGEGNTWWHPLRIVDTFLERSGLDYKDLLRLLNLKSFNPQGQIRLQFKKLNDCDPKTITIEQLNAQALSYLHRLLRLQRASGFSLQEMDQILSALSPETQQGRPAINERLLVRLSHLVNLREKFHLSLAELLSWWSPLDTADYNAPNLPPSRSFYESLFLTGRPHESQYSAFNLNSARTEIKGATSPLNEPLHLSAIAGATRLPVPDVVDLINRTIPEPDAAKLTLANVSMIFRHASLARTLGLSVTDYVTVKTLISFDPFTTTNGVDKTVQTLRFIERAELVKASGFSIARLDYLLRQVEPYESGKTIAPTDDWVDGVLESVHAALEPLAPFGTHHNTLKEAIETLGVGPGTTATADELRPLIEKALEQIGVAGEVGTDNALETLLREARDLVAPGATVDHAIVYAKLKEASDILNGALIQAAATALTDALGISAAAALLMHVQSPVADETAGETILRAFVSSNENGGTSPTDAELRLVLRRLHKAALVVGMMEITHGEIPLLGSKSQSAGWLDLTTLPVQGAITQPAFEPWARLVRLFQFRNLLLPEQQEHLFELFEIADQFQPGTTPHANHERQAYAAKLAELSGWSPDDVLALVGKFDIGAISHGGGGILQARFPQQFGDEHLPQRILAAVKLLRRLGATAFDVESWVAPPLNSTQRSSQVERIKNALKSRYGDGWADAVKKLRDPLRERQRQALVTYLLHNWNLERADDLFDHFLIDVEMSPCMMTSRLIQATASVQLFVQRVVMNLEPGLYLTEDGAEQWEWMKHYRVWEANRKIFLYPENWIEPQLRDDKTPFFKDLENELMQADITNETAETALLHYLEKLHEVARLQVCGQYLEPGNTENPAKLHVFARTRDVPHHYYYRRGELGIDAEGIQSGGKWASAFDANWTHWERVDVEIEGDHFIPVVYNRRLYLFWPIFTSEDEAPLTHLTQQVMEVLSSVLRLQHEIGTLIRGMFQGLGTALIAGTANSIIHMLRAIEKGINLLPKILDDDSLSLTYQKNRVRDIRRDLLMSVGVDTSDKTGTHYDVTSEIIEKVDLLELNDIKTILDEASAVVTSLEEHFIKFLPAKRLEVQIAWSEYKNDSWSAKKTSSGVVSFRDVVSTFFESLPQLPGLGGKGVKRLFTFRGWVDSQNRLQVDCNIALPRSVFKEGNKPDQWLSEPTTIGYFRLNSCNGRLEAFDTEEDLGLLDLASQVLSESLDDAQDILGELQAGRQLQQRGEPITPDDDPNRPSSFRDGFRNGSWPPLPGHMIRQGESVGKDVYRLLARHQTNNDNAKRDGFFYHDASRTFLCFPWLLPINNPGKPKGRDGYVFFPFYHPYTCALLENLQRFGIPGIYDVRFDRNSGGSFVPDAAGQPLQIALNNDTFFNAPEYDPIDYVYNPADGPRALRPVEEINFSTIGAYATYNWEIFFHIPLLIATRLSTDQKFREAQHWFHYIFNPTDASQGAVPEKYWRTKPFVEASAENYERQQIEELLQMLNAEAETPGLQELEWAVRAWRENAFNPHLVARARTVAFQKAVVMKYIDNLIAWGDSLFRQETREAVYEATQLYILAAKLLGPRPRRTPKGYERPEYSYLELTNARQLDAFSNALVEIESYLPPPGSGPLVGKKPYAASDYGRLDRASLAPVSQAVKMLVNSRSLRDVVGGIGSWRDKGKQEGEALYFCVPPNDVLLEKWELVADRLFKIRHCQNIEGRALILPLLSPPIDPAILVRAKATGVNIDTVLSQFYVPLPHYRFQVLAQKAADLCGEVKALGSALLSALEKRDGEELALLRNTHEMRLLKAVQGVKEKQVEEANRALDGLMKSQETTTLRRDHYQRLLMEFMIPEEIAGTVLGAGSLVLQGAQFGAKTVAAAASLIPNVKGGFVTTLGLTYGGDNIGFGAERAADALGHLASLLSSAGGLLSTMGSYRRRAEDWLLQVQTAGKELEAMDQQIAAAEIRVAIAESDLENHKLQIENGGEVHDFMQQKFTNQELYDWMVGQVSMLYFQSYQLAYDLARKAERAFTFELGVDNQGIIQAPHWDSLKKGLLAGDFLYHDLKRLEVAYLDQNKREFEITKHVSVLRLDPIALLQLRETGACQVNLPETLFDMDFPGHFMRRIKSVGITVPCVTGPYTGLNCTLTLVKSSVRRERTLLNGQYIRDLSIDDARFADDFGAVQQIAISSGQNDLGLFDAHLRDERYLPFEGAGVISEWRIELPKGLRQFDYQTISDVVLHIRYTARAGEESLRQGAAAHLAATVDAAQIAGSVRLFSVRHEFPTEWARFKAVALSGTVKTAELALNLREEHYPFWSKGRLAQIKNVEVCARISTEVEIYDKADPLDPTFKKDSLRKDVPVPGLFGGKLTNITMPAPTGKWSLYYADNSMDDLWVALTWGK